MATVTKTVGASDSADYATISLWYNARRSQPSSGDTEVCVLEDGDHDWNGWQGGWADVDLTVKFQAQNSHGGVWANGARIVPTGQMSFPSREDDTTIEFIDLVFDFPAAYRPLYLGTSSTTTSKTVNVTMTRCLAYNASTNSPIIRNGNNAPGATNITATNCVLESEGAPWCDVPYSSSTQTDTYVVMTACTVRDAIVTLQRHSSNSSTNSSVVTNGCLIAIDASMNGGQMVALTANSYARGGSSVDCITTEAEATHDNWADNSRTNATYGVTFNIDGSAPASGEVSWVGGTPPKLDFSLVENANNLAIGYATNATMPSGDIEGNVRPASPDAGAYQSATSVSLTPGVGSLTTTSLTPSVSVATVLTPGVTALSMTPSVATAVVATNLTPGVAALAITTLAPSAVATSSAFLIPGTVALSTTQFVPVVGVGHSLTPGLAQLVIAGAESDLIPVVVASTPRSIITHGSWTTATDFVAGDEWAVTISGAAANAPQIRVQLIFE